MHVEVFFTILHVFILFIKIHFLFLAVMASNSYMCYSSKTSNARKAWNTPIDSTQEVDNTAFF